MAGKTPVSAIQELCAKYKRDLPKYSITNAAEGGFNCEIQAMGISEHGHGHSKQDAKHTAATNALNALRATYCDIARIQIVSHKANPLTYMVGASRKHSIESRQSHLLLNLFHSSGQRSGGSDTKVVANKIPIFLRPVAAIKPKAATINTHKQSTYLVDTHNAGKEELKTQEHGKIDDLDKRIEVLSLDDCITKHLDFKTESKKNPGNLAVQMVETPDTNLKNRHNYFTKYPEEFKASARKVLDTPYLSKETQAFEVLQALKLTPKCSEISSLTEQPLIFIELNCSYDVVFCNWKDKVYNDIVNYFQDMLKEK